MAVFLSLLAIGRAVVAGSTTRNEGFVALNPGAWAKTLCVAAGRE